MNEFEGSNDAVRDLEELSRELGLRPDRQDWGIVNADGRRVKEFMAFFASDREKTRGQEVDLVELILASANEALQVGVPLDLDSLAVAIPKYQNAADFHVQYWASLSDRLNYPIGAWLRELLDGPR